MAVRYTASASYPYKKGALFLGTDPETGAEVGIETERNAITIAGAGGGKGACLIIPNLLRWPYAALVIDPKGENAEETAKARRAMGQKVGVFDPFKKAKVSKRLRVSINPLNLSGKSDVAPSRDDILAIADGIVRRTDPEAEKWDNGARTIIAGVIAFVCMAPPEKRTLAEARRILMRPDVLPTEDGDDIGLKATAERMIALGGLAAAGGVSILTAITSGRGADKEYLSGARQHSLWLDSEEMEAALSSTSFNLKDLAKGKATLFVVLPYGKMELYGAFLRLVVRIAQNTIAEAGNKRGPEQKCLFILDEFFTLGKMDEIQRACGNMRSYGLQIWPFLQDYGQLTTLYREDGAGTFFANADAHMYFNMTDDITLARVSNQLDKTLPHEAAEAPPELTPFVAKPFRPWRDSKWTESEKTARERHEVEQRNLRDVADTARKAAHDRYHHNMQATGGARMPPDQVAKVTGKPSSKEPSNFMIGFVRGDVLKVKLLPFFAPENTTSTAFSKDNENEKGAYRVKRTREVVLAEIKAQDHLAGYNEIGSYIADQFLENFIKPDALVKITPHLEAAWLYAIAVFTATILMIVKFEAYDWSETAKFPITVVLVASMSIIALRIFLIFLGFAIVRFYRAKMWFEDRATRGQA